MGILGEEQMNKRCLICKAKLDKGYVIDWMMRKKICLDCYDYRKSVIMSTNDVFIAMEGYKVPQFVRSERYVIKTM